MNRASSAENLSHDPPSVEGVVDVLSEAFFDYPVMRFVIGPGEVDYPARLRTLVEFFVRARIFRGEHLLGVRDSEGLAAAAIVSRPDGSPAPAGFLEYRRRIWAELGPEAEARYDAFGEAGDRVQKRSNCHRVLRLHLNMIGVRASGQGRGLGRKLLERVHRLSAEDPASEGVSLNTEVEANLALYEHFGYRLIGEAEVAPGLTTWGFWRPDS